jgi:hypothetical protein
MGHEQPCQPAPGCARAAKGCQLVGQRLSPVARSGPSGSHQRGDGWPWSACRSSGRSSSSTLNECSGTRTLEPEAHCPGRGAVQLSLRSQCEPEAASRRPRYFNNSLGTSSVR